jgi:hypothetical protein
MPNVPPTPPPKRTDRNSFLSGILQHPDFALLLSMYIRKKASAFTRRSAKSIRPLLLLIFLFLCRGLEKLSRDFFIFFHTTAYHIPTLKQDK